MLTAHFAPLCFLHIYYLHSDGEPHLGVGLGQSDERFQLPWVRCHCTTGAPNLTHI